MPPPIWTIELRGTAVGYVEVDADTEDEAWNKARDRGLELDDVREVLDAEPYQTEEWPVDK